MANQFTDINIIEANRLHSEEAKSGNNENTSLWTNNLQDIIHLNPSDKVSVYGSFISERGAGQQSSIEVKGVELPQKKFIEYTTITPQDVSDKNTTGYVSVDSQQNNDEFQLRDDTLRFTTSYYIPSNAHNSLQLPRRWIFGHPVTPDIRLNYTSPDDKATNGASLTERIFVAGKGSWADKNEYYNCLPLGGLTLHKFKNKNDRFTFLIRDKTYFDIPSPAPAGTFPPLDLRDPENAVYNVYKELKTFTIPSGFNSAQFVSEEITRQFQKLVSNRLIEIKYDNNGVALDYPIGLSRIIESETYKNFKAWNIIDGANYNFQDYFNLLNKDGSGTPKPEWIESDGFNYLSQYQIIATKYPELYDAGSKINLIPDPSEEDPNPNGVNAGILGAYLWADVGDPAVDEYAGWITSIPYTKENCEKLKAFFDAQLLYPEIIINTNDDGTGYNKGNDVTNTRWLHCNRYSSKKMYLGDDQEDATKENTMLGWSGYYYPRNNWNTTKVSQHSGLLCLYFDNSQKDIFYENPINKLVYDEDLDALIPTGEYTYGCLGKSVVGAGPGNPSPMIVIYPASHKYNGYDTPAYNQFMDDTPESGEGDKGILAGGKLGFDYHFNAPGMYYLSPMSGWGLWADDAIAPVNEANYEVNPANYSGTATINKHVSIEKYKDMLYIGADNPSLEWDGTHFGFKGLHTGLNRGNRSIAGNPYHAVTPDIDALDTVYKINPAEQLNDYTPDRMPYDTYGGFNTGSWVALPDASNNFATNKLNSNLVSWGIYDMLGGVFIEDYGMPEELWDDSLWGILGFTYNQFNSKTNNRQLRIQSDNNNQLSKLTTNAEIVEGDIKIFITNWSGVPIYNNMVASPTNVPSYSSTGTPRTLLSNNTVYPAINHKTQSITIMAENLPTRMIRGYYTIRSNILEGSPFVGGKVNNTNMPVIGIVDKINGDGDFYFGQDSSLEFTITKPIRLASLSVSIHDPDGSYARTNNQSTILFKIQKTVSTTFNVVEELLQEDKNNPVLKTIFQ